MNQRKTAPTHVRPSPPFTPSAPLCTSDARGACVLETGTHNLLPNLGALIRYACARSDSLAALAQALGSTPAEVRKLAKSTGVRLPEAWLRRKR